MKQHQLHSADNLHVYANVNLLALPLRELYFFTKIQDTSIIVMMSICPQAITWLSMQMEVFHKGELMTVYSVM